MNRVALKLLLFVLLLGFGVFFGVGLANRGIERVQGPINPSQLQEAQAGDGQQGNLTDVPADSGEGQQAKELEQAAASRKQSKSQAPVSQAPIPQVQVKDAAFSNHLVNKTGELLRMAAHQSIHLVVSVLDKVLR